MSNYADPEYFERLYQRDPDPWKFATSDYEREKYTSTLAALPERRFSRCFEVGCSIGVLTRQLAGRCGSLLGVDVSETALAQARARCADLAGVTIKAMAVPDAWPEGGFDLIVFSEVLYYLGLAGIETAARRTLESLESGGAVMLVNWRGATDGACTGEEAAALFTRGVAERLQVMSSRIADKYRVDLLA